MIRTQKDAFIQDMQGALDKAAAVFFVDYTGMTVEEVTTFRKKLRASSLGFKVVKNTLIAKAMAGKPFEALAKSLKGAPTGVVFGKDDPVAAAKVTFEFLKECEHIKIKGGVLDAKPLTAKDVEALSKMPGRRELLGQIIAQFMSPAGKLAAQIKNPGGKLVGALDAKAKGSES